MARRGELRCVLLSSSSRIKMLEHDFKISITEHYIISPTIRLKLAKEKDNPQLFDQKTIRHCSIMRSAYCYVGTGTTKKEIGGAEEYIVI
ncbi:hypothetical protein RJ640_007339 [Escallonia rubra]|uniref:Uncharacterized protein n=1 Tax=Escallonia rubra TaxID=112253 RepID=A0AA88UW96_9ASTE|nr:hypothetical protein RJ640_007339 [Escallonia rubra]